MRIKSQVKVRNKSIVLNLRFWVKFGMMLGPKFQVKIGFWVSVLGLGSVLRLESKLVTS